jgi:hypothetical protein
LKIKDRLLAQAEDWRKYSLCVNNYTTKSGSECTREIDELQKSIGPRIMAAKTRQEAGRLLFFQAKETGRILKKYGYKTRKFHANNVPILQKYGVLAAQPQTSVSIKHRAYKRSYRVASKSANRHKGGDGSGGDDGPCPDPDVISNKIKTSLGSRRARSIRKVGTPKCPNHFTCPVAVLSRNLGRFIFLADSGLYYAHKAENAPYRFVSARLLPAGSSRRPK